jgi:hypothetical protein
MRGDALATHLPKLLSVLILLASATLCACPDKNSGTAPPAITLTAINCPAKDVRINVKPSKNLKSGKWRITLDVTVTCGDQPTQAEFKVQVSNWWSQKYKTDNQGKLTVTGPAEDGDPGGESAKVTVLGSGNSEATQTVSIP